MHIVRGLALLIAVWPALVLAEKTKVVVLPFTGSTPQLNQVGASVAEQVLTEPRRK